VISLTGVSGASAMAVGSGESPEISVTIAGVCAFLSRPVETAAMSTATKVVLGTVAVSALLVALLVANLALA